MSIANEVQRIKNNIAESYNIIEQKGGIIPSAKSSANLSDAIKSLGNVPITYIAEGESGGSYRCFIYKNNGGQKGSLVVTITRHNWATFSQYASEIEIALDNVCSSWTGVGVPLNFAKLKSAGKSFMGSCQQFNQIILFPMLENTELNFMNGCYAFNQDIDFPLLEITKNNFMYDCIALNNKKITFHKLKINSANGNFMEVYSGNANTNIIALEFQLEQNMVSLPTGFCRSRNTYNNIHGYVDLRIRQGSANVNATNKTWAGHTFRSVTLI